jgi:hypothetical protein
VSARTGSLQAFGSDIYVLKVVVFACRWLLVFKWFRTVHVKSLEIYPLLAFKGRIWRLTGRREILIWRSHEIVQIRSEILYRNSLSASYIYSDLTQTQALYSEGIVVVIQ